MQNEYEMSGSNVVAVPDQYIRWMVFILFFGNHFLGDSNIYLSGIVFGCAGSNENKPGYE